MEARDDARDTEACVEGLPVWVGAFFTTALFVAGKFLIGFYLSRSDPGSSSGAAGALAVILGAARAAGEP